jgi:hypothetical protein
MLVLLQLRKKIINLKNHGKKRVQLKIYWMIFLFMTLKIFPALEDSMHKLYKWGIYIRPPLQSMIAKNITLLGDAAHPNGSIFRSRCLHGN